MEEKELESFNLTIIVILSILRKIQKITMGQVQLLEYNQVNQFIKLIGNFLKFKEESFSLVLGLLVDNQLLLFLEKVRVVIFSKIQNHLFHM